MSKKVTALLEGIGNGIKRLQPETIGPPLLTADLVEDKVFKTQGTGRNWLFRRS